MKITLEKLVESWRLSPDLHELRAGAIDSDIDRFEIESGWEMPEDWRRLYQVSNGGSLVQGNVNFYPLFGSELSVLAASTFLRNVSWPVPNELHIVGDNGAGEPFGLWHSSNPSPPPVISIGAIFLPGCMSVSGSSLMPFLCARTAYYLMLCEGPTAALDALRVPQHLRSEDPDDATWDAIVEWADPDRPKMSDSPYVAKLDAMGIRRAFEHAA